MDVFLSAEKLYSSSGEQETDNTPITRPLNELLPVHPLTVYLQHHIAVDQMTVGLAVYRTHIFSVEIRLAECELYSYSVDHLGLYFHATSMLLGASVSSLLKTFLNTALVYNREVRFFRV